MMENYFSSVGIAVPEIYLPSASVDLYTWAVVACDQYTSQIEYWKQVEKIVGTAPSLLHIIYPEVYLHHEDSAERIARIHTTMQAYLSQGILQSLGHCFVLVERKTSHTNSRK